MSRADGRLIELLLNLLRGKLSKHLVHLGESGASDVSVGGDEWRLRQRRRHERGGSEVTRPSSARFYAQLITSSDADSLQDTRQEALHV